MNIEIRGQKKQRQTFSSRESESGATHQTIPSKYKLGLSLLLILAFTNRSVQQTAIYQTEIDVGAEVRALQIRDYHSDFFFLTTGS